MIAAWQIRSMSDVKVDIATWRESMASLCHLGTTSRLGDDGRRCGQAVWGLKIDGAGAIGIAWDWEEVRAGVVAMSDPMTVSSNASFIDDSGSPVDDFKRILHLNNAIFSLPWQAAVRQGEGELLAAA